MTLKVFLFQQAHNILQHLCASSSEWQFNVFLQFALKWFSIFIPSRPHHRSKTEQLKIFILSAKIPSQEKRNISWHFVTFRVGFFVTDIKIRHFCVFHVYIKLHGQTKNVYNIYTFVECRLKPTSWNFYNTAHYYVIIVYLYFVNFIFSVYYLLN